MAHPKKENSYNIYTVLICIIQIITYVCVYIYIYVFLCIYIYIFIIIYTHTSVAIHVDLYSFGGCPILDPHPKKIGILTVSRPEFEADLRRYHPGFSLGPTHVGLPQ